MKITIKKGIDAEGKNYRKIIYTNDAGTEEESSDALSRMLTHTTIEGFRGIFTEGSDYVTKGNQRLYLTPITADMDDLTRARIIGERIRTARHWADTIAEESTVTVTI